MPLPRGMLRLTDEELNELLTSERTLRIGTVSGDGTPHVAPMWFLWRDGVIWLTSLRRSKRQSDLATGSRVALCVDTGTEYGELRGAVLYGTPADADHDPDMPEARKAFAQKNWGIDDLPDIKSHVWLKLVPDKIVSWDFRKIPTNADPRFKYGPKPPEPSNT
jgi:pyridoxamine 5'-phosphate oxidase-like protein